ncbi:hypothetical protein HYFRA_00010312 [Hymenoscyphus fraxineus]|uniref:Cellobiose dehydrogenase-like cytochrome domain-containing protein n=1 Tax=Hymenoscyphus fraxineus TaxID=746836 RepID=A0A9N9PQ68_9HELO|nr:hypothetical protein HYFRA_00010312 [Hymenoscyphus fraxineus]
MLSQFFLIAPFLPYLVYAGDDDVNKTGPITSAFTDPLSNITFQRFFGQRSTFSFGIALPTNKTTDFIGQMTFPTPSGDGWGGIALAGNMVGPLLLAAWPNGEQVVSTFRRASSKSSPPVLDGPFQIKEIKEGTKINSTHMQFTFLCQGCLGLNGTLGFETPDAAGNVQMGWALASTSVTTKGDPASEMTFHDSGFGIFTAQLSLAKSPDFAKWAALATGGGSAAPVVPAPAGTPTPALNRPVPIASPTTATRPKKVDKYERL